MKIKQNTSLINNVFERGGAFLLTALKTVTITKEDQMEAHRIQAAIAERL